MLPCRDVTELIGTDQLLHAPLGRRLEVRLHLAMCMHCRAYARSLRQLARLGQRMAVDQPKALSSRAEEVIQLLNRTAIAMQHPDAPTPGDPA